MQERMSVLHLAYESSPAVRERLEDWDRGLRSTGPILPNDWAVVALGAPLRGATISASAGIEGNPLTPTQVREVLDGLGSATGFDVREVVNISDALERAEAAAFRSNFRWTEEIVHQLNATLMRGLPDDTHGEYRREAVNVGGFFDPLDWRLVPAYMDELIRWLDTETEHPLVRVALLHLNLVAIHPFVDGNGRTARVLSSLELMRAGVATPDLINVEAYLRANQGEYFSVLRTTLGPTYRPEEHGATPWVDYYTSIALGRLRLRNTILEDPLPRDLGILALALQRSGCPVEWAAILLGARMAPLRTSSLARVLGRSVANVREELAEIVGGGWLTPVGNTRARRYVPSAQLEQVPLRVPSMIGGLIEGRQLELWGSTLAPAPTATLSVGIRQSVTSAGPDGR